MSCIWDNPFMDVPSDVQKQIDRLTGSPAMAAAPIFSPIAPTPSAHADEELRRAIDSCDELTRHIRRLQPGTAQPTAPTLAPAPKPTAGRVHPPMTSKDPSGWRPF